MDCGVLVVHRQPLVRWGLSTLISSQPGFQSEGALADPCGLGGQYDQRPISLLVVEHRPEDRTGGDCLDRLTSALHPKPRLILIAQSLSDWGVDDLLRRNALGCVSAESSIEAILACVREVMNGGRYFSDELADRIIRRSRASGNPESGPSDIISCLTPRERMVLEFLARGLRVREVAEALSVSRKTIENHKSHLMSKLNVRSHVQLVLLVSRLESRSD